MWRNPSWLWKQREPGRPSLKPVIIQEMKTLGEDDRLGCIDAKENNLPVDRSIQEHERDKNTFCASVVDGCVAVFNGNSDGERGNINNADHNAQVDCNAYICPTIDEGRSGT
jgi:hypothetical protein